MLELTLKIIVVLNNDYFFVQENHEMAELFSVGKVGKIQFFTFHF